MEKLGVFFFWKKKTIRFVGIEGKGAFMEEMAEGEVVFVMVFCVGNAWKEGETNVVVVCLVGGRLT